MKGLYLKKYLIIYFIFKKNDNELKTYEAYSDFPIHFYFCKGKVTK